MTRVTQVTHGAHHSNATYFLQQSFLPGDRGLIFISYETGTPQVCEISLRSGEQRRLTDGPGIHPFSAAQHPGEKEIVFTRRDSLCAIDRTTLQERIIVQCDGASLGECSISPDGDWITAAFRRGEDRGLLVAAWDGSGVRTIAFPRTVIHPQFHPLEPDWIEFAGDPAPRMHRVRRDGSGMECLYEHDNDEFVVHETFLGSLPSSGGDLVFTVWPRLVCRLDWTTRHISTIAEYNAWHIAPDRAGARVLCDTNYPDEGIQIISVADGSRTPVCKAESSNQGSQWRTSRYALKEDFERARACQGPVLSWMEADSDTVYGPQRTHPHPSWSRDEKRIVFTSDRTGVSQVYIAELL